MSTGSDRRMCRARQRGYTFLEVSVSVILTASMALVVERTLGSTKDAESYLSAVRRAAERSHRLAYEVREHVTASRRLFSDDAVGRDYFAALDLSRAPPMPGVRMPVVGSDRRLGPDESGDPQTGNVLFFVCEMDARPAIAEPTLPTIRYIDTYRFICCYPRETARRVVVDERRKRALDLVVWQSVEFPNYKQLIEIEDPTERATVVADLQERYGHTLAWDVQGEVDAAFHAIDRHGNIAAEPVPGVSIAEDASQSRGGRLVYANMQLARTDPESRRRRAIMSADDPGDWRPDGFEVKIAGGSGSRTVWFHVVVEAPASLGRVAAQPCTIIASVKDL